MSNKSKVLFLLPLMIICWLAAAHPASMATTLYVANNGVDTGVCGAKLSPCRSITVALARAAYGATIVVGPGVYGDLNQDGVLGDSPGEEIQAEDCICMIRINKPVKLVSSAGAEATIIDAKALKHDMYTVQIEANNVTFGLPGKGFTVTGTSDNTSSPYAYAGIYVSAGTGVTVSGNQVLGLSYYNPGYGSYGIEIDPSAGVVQIQGNQVIGWAIAGISGGPQTTISNNTIALTTLDSGIITNGATVSGNLVTANPNGINLYQGGAVSGNAIIGNYGQGIYASDALGTAEGNNIFGNGCGLNASVAGLVADNNYWGAATGPGADSICTGSASAVVTPYATTPFTVTIKFNP
ncbi:MAG: nitrous oxide reductase family maturation protein NosD [Candidatus Sulfotelmatobacter sp.]